MSVPIRFGGFEMTISKSRQTIYQTYLEKNHEKL